jgi:hypothetical protein
MHDYTSGDIKMQVKLENSLEFTARAQSNSQVAPKVISILSSPASEAGGDRSLSSGLAPSDVVIRITDCGVLESDIHDIPDSMK